MQAGLFNGSLKYARMDSLYLISVGYQPLLPIASRKQELIIGNGVKSYVKGA
eukprot:COSAG01_NODE_44985_length_413_cov_9.490446_1_plen_51_part_01